MSRDIWEKLVVAVLRKEKDREIARAPSLDPSDVSSRSSFCDSAGAGAPSMDPSDVNSRLSLSSVSSYLNSLSSPRHEHEPVSRPQGKHNAWYRRWKLSVHFFDVPAEEDPEVHLGQLKRFSLRELQVATNKGRLADGSLVAVKTQKRAARGELQFQIEIETTGFSVHQNLIRLRGFCMTPTLRLLVYPYVANGKRSESQPPLDWTIRKRISFGVARALAYLHDHCDPKIIHRNVKAANILLDDDFEAVVSDFGLAKLMDYKDTHVTTVVRGTIGYIAPEYHSTGKCSEKSDVFADGVMLLELITGQRAFDQARLPNDYDVMLLDRVKELLKQKKLETLVDADLQGNYIEEEVEQLIQVALLCTQNSPTERPKMSALLRMFEGPCLDEKWEKWQKEEMLRQELNPNYHPNTGWTIPDSTSNVQPDELSGPR